MKVGFIGLGIMGSRMASNLLAQGHDLVVYNRTNSKAEPLVEKGAMLASSAREAGEQAEILFTMLADPTAVEAMALGAEGFLDGMQTGTLWVDSSTVDPAFSRRMAEEAGRREVRMLDAPVAGTKGPAEKGELLFFVGGDTRDLEEVRHLMEIMGRKVVHVGEQGMGVSLKMVFNLLLGVGMLVFSEGLALGEALGISRERMLETLIGGAVTPPFLSYKRGKIESGDYKADFPLQWIHKDLHLAAVTGFNQGVPLPSANAAKEIYALAKNQGLAGEDFAAIYAYISGNGER